MIPFHQLVLLANTDQENHQPLHLLNQAAQAAAMKLQVRLVAAHIVSTSS